MKTLLKYTLLLFLGITCNYSYGQLVLNSELAAGQYSDATAVNAEPGTIAIGGNAANVIHMFPTASCYVSSVSYGTQLPTNILTNEANHDQQLPNTSLPVGKTPYACGVSLSGGAVYNVPIVIPPGTMGMVPKLAIVYNSQSANGMLGYGWNLSGLSCISRLGQTPYHNFQGKYPDQTQGVTLTNADWFALDGNRLITRSGSNGANGTTYATESETFNLITSHGTVGSGPDWFTIQTKSGLTMEYGRSLNSRLVPVGENTVFVWYIDKITDQFGNYISFNYTNSNGEIRIAEIDYTGNSTNSNVGFTPYNSIVFNYVDRTDANTTYVAGGALNLSVVLNNITINSHGTFFKEYSFKYVYNLYTMLQEIDETGSDNTTLNPLQFSYGSDAPVVGSECEDGPTLLSNYCVQADPYELGGIADGNSGLGGAAQFTLLDYNGDGKEDVIALTGSYAQNIGGGEGPPVLLNSYSFTWSNQTLYTGENSCPYFAANSYTFSEGFPNSISNNGYEFPISNVGLSWQGQSVGDFNGDGKDDYAVSTFSTTSIPEGGDVEEDIHVALSTGSSFATPNVVKAYDMYSTPLELASISAPAGSTFSTTLYLDLNGDGQTDIFNYHFDFRNGVEYYRVWLNAGASSTTPQEQLSTTCTVTPTPPTSPNFEVTVGAVTDKYLDFSKAIPMDLNGDGKVELVNVYQMASYSSPTRVIVSFDATQTYGQSNYAVEVDGGVTPGVPGNGIVIQSDNSPFNYNINTFGASDSIYPVALYTLLDSPYSSYYAGDPYDNVYGVSTSIDNAGSPYVLFGDFNGDGISDVLTYSSTGHNWTLNLGKGGGYYASVSVSSLSSDNPFSYPTYYYYAHDVNGDGKTDILEFIPNYNDSGKTLINTYYSTGTSFVQGQPIRINNHDINPQTWQISFGDFNGDGVDDLLLENMVGDGAVDGGPILLYFYSGSNSRRLVESVDGYNKTVQFSYLPLTNSSVYSQPKASDFRNYSNDSALLDIQPPIYVVSRLTTVDGTGNNATASISKDNISNYITYVDTSSTTYSYQDLISSNLGLGMLGFLNISSYNSLTDYSTSSNYSILHQFENLVPGTNTVTAVTEATTLSDGAYTFTAVPLGGLRYMVNPIQSVTNDDWAGVTSTTTYTFTSDNNGNLQEAKTQITTGSSTVETVDVQKTYTTSGTWIPSSVATTTTTATYLANPSYTRTSSNNWDAAGHLISVVADPSTGEAVTTTNTYDPRTGTLLTQVTSSADASCPTFTTSCTYDGYSQFKTSSTNALGQVTSYSYNPMWGKIASVTTPDNLTTTYTYDAWGRSAQITTPDALVQSITYTWVTPSELPIDEPDPFSITSTSLYQVNSSKSGSPPMTTFYDWSDRKTLYETSSLNANIFKEQSYDALGHDYQSTNTYQKASISGAYGDYDPVITTKLYSDLKHRLTSITSTCISAPTLSTTFSYTTSSGNTTVTTTKPDGTQSSHTTDPAGFLVSSIDYPYGGYFPYSSVDYTYFSNGHAASVVLNGNTVNSFTYDAFGRQTSLSDINFVNNYSYTYNAYNQLTSQEDPNGDTYSMTYDIMGRIKEKVTPEGTYTYNYVMSGNGLNLLQSQQLGSSIISYTYNAVHKPTQVNVNGLITSYTYDAYNNVYTKTYPGGFEITNTYNAYGYLTETDQTSGSIPIWQAQYMNPRGQYVDYILGTGSVHTVKSYTPYGFLIRISSSPVAYEDITFDYDQTNGNLLSRIEKGNLTESFTYDASLKSRLTEAQAYYPCASVAGESPSLITADVTMAYDQNGNIVNKLDICAPSTTYTDAFSNNQVTSVPNSSSIINPGQSVSYTSFNAPSTIALGTYTTTFTYGPDNNREQTSLTDGTNTATRYYGNSYEKTLLNGSNPVEVNYVQCGGDLVGMYVNETSGGDMYYVYSDNVGSILTVTDGADSTFRQSFDAWGNYRDTLSGSYTEAPPASNPSWLYRGFTGHEHLAQMQLINANGRLYDPFINSMLSPDITVQAPTNTQNFNRYSYCLNNPLKYTDPSGFYTFMTPRWTALEFMGSPQGEVALSYNALCDVDIFDIPLSTDTYGGGGGGSSDGGGGGSSDGGGGGSDGGGGGGNSGSGTGTTGNTGPVSNVVNNGGGAPNGQPSDVSVGPFMGPPEPSNNNSSNTGGALNDNFLSTVDLNTTVTQISDVYVYANSPATDNWINFLVNGYTNAMTGLDNLFQGHDGSYQSGGINILTQSKWGGTAIGSMGGAKYTYGNMDWTNAEQLLMDLLPSPSTSANSHLEGFYNNYGTYNDFQELINPSNLGDTTLLEDGTKTIESPGLGGMYIIPPTGGGTPFVIPEGH